jgi:hypothetical protein
MKNLILSVVVVGALCLIAGGKNSDLNVGLPKLHQIKIASLSPSYSCRSSEEFRKGYQNTALFLSDYAKDRNSPDLLFNGACRGDDYFESSGAGDDMSLIADLGSNVVLEDLTASRAFNLQRVHSFPAYSQFAKAVKVQTGHTYAVLVNSSDRRALFVFTVAEYVPNQKVELKYAVKSYQVTPSGQISSSSGFAWEQKNALAATRQ